MQRREFFARVPELFERANRISWEQYEETIFHMQRPLTHGNFHRVKQFVGGNPPVAALRDPRDFPELDRQLSKARYPRAGQLTRLDGYAEGNTEFATALMHFNNPAYPIFDARTVRGLNHLGHPIDYVREVAEAAVPAYQAYIDLIQGLKDEIPYYCVPEKNYYLTRIVQQALWQLGVETPAPVAAKKVARRGAAASA
jgi:hypothetical protein